MIEKHVLHAHREHFGQDGQVYAAPARVNLIGEHTDYTGGLVMPMAIGFQTVAAVSPRQDGRAVFYSMNFDEEIAFEIASQGVSPSGHWSDYPAGVLWCLGQAGVVVSGFNMTLGGDVPLGAGLSSSASVEVATAMALLKHAGATLPLAEIATLCRRAENEYVGAKSGIMDQFVVAGGVVERAMLLDCRSLDYELLPLPSAVKVVICNSMVKHAHADGEYGDRRDEVESGQAVVVQERPGVAMLRDATVADLDACRDKMSEASFLRCRHIVTENARVLEAREALLEGDMKHFGVLMEKAHVSFRDDFQASCAEIDTLVEIASRQPECFGARITGGGFGGCTVNVVRAADAERFVETLRREYEAATGIVADCFVCEASDGALAMLTHRGAQ
ncbi:galactokinase [Granulicella arctica]|uniref:Galactokinase n=1 Tax=Granulicella arctica TaxID=940613 RepID=A0A7Y9PJB0_9BACT|nr:galactokinase [Granulicella arctica]